MKVQGIILRAIAKKITRIQGAQIIGVSAKQMRCRPRRYEKHGYDGLFDRRTGKPSPRRGPPPEVALVYHLHQEHHFDFNVKHFHERLPAGHEIEIGNCLKNMITFWPVVGPSCASYLDKSSPHS